MVEEAALLAFSQKEVIKNWDKVEEHELSTSVEPVHHETSEIYRAPLSPSIKSERHSVSVKGEKSEMKDNEESKIDVKELSWLKDLIKTRPRRKDSRPSKKTTQREVRSSNSKVLPILSSEASVENEKYEELKLFKGPMLL